VELIKQVNAKEIDKSQFWELVAELYLDRAMGESVANGPVMTQVTMQDKDVGESKQDESVGEEEPEAAVIAVESSTIDKWKQKVAPAKTKVFSEVHGPVSQSAKVVINMQLTHHAHSATGVSCARPSRHVSPPCMSGTARSASQIRVGAPGGGRVVGSLRVR
jgi:hypothetical protein